MIVASLFPLALSPEASQLRDAGPGFLWIAALLSSLLALDGLFRTDVQDGSMEQLALSPAPGADRTGKDAGALARQRGAVDRARAVPRLIFLSAAGRLTGTGGALALATPTLSVLAALGAALTVSIRGGGAIIGLLELPLTAPVLIFGTRATDLAIHGEPAAGPLYLLAAFAVLAISLGPLACAAALRVGLE